MDLDIYVVKSGDSVYRIAQKYGVSVQRIVDANGLEDPNRLAVGQALVIPIENASHTIQPGESLYSIARRYGVSVENLVAANPQIANPALIYPGQVILIPKTSKLGTIDVNGYAYPNIRTNVLESTLPYLTYLSIFSYQARWNGTLVPITDDSIITRARNQNVAPMMVVTNIDENGGFSSELAKVILTDVGVQDVLLNHIVTTLNNKRYYGLDIDFEYIYPENREDYNRFLEKVVARLHPLGYTVTTAVAPKLSGNQGGLLYEGHDYEAHGRIVDHIIIMTYEWGYTYSAPQAVAPVNQVERVLQYATSVIPSEKILMGMPNYGYDWSLPYVKGTAARAISNQAAINLAIARNARIEFDQEAMAPYFYYRADDGGQHVVWFDDARGIDARLRLVAKYRLGGVSYWTINTFFKQNWSVLEALYYVNKLI